MVNWIKFLGTAGGRVVVFRQLRHSGGIWLNLEGINIVIDPGPGSLIRIFENSLDPQNIDIFVLSHRHLDHSADINSVVESATQSTKVKKDLLIAPKDAIEGEEPVFLKYLRKGIKNIVYTNENLNIEYKDINIKAHIKHKHRGADTYGLSFESKNKKIVYVPCGRFFEDMLYAYPKNADIMIFNTTFVKPKPAIDHLSAKDVKKMISYLNPKLAVLTHFSIHMLKENPDEVANNIEKETGIKTISAKDGMKLRF